MGTCRAQVVPAEPQPYWEGPYSPIPVHSVPGAFHNCCEIAHAVLIGKRGASQGKVLIIQSNGQRWTWDPAAPNSVTSDPAAGSVQDLFCAGHSVDGEGNIVVHGGNRHVPGGTPPACPQTAPFCGPQPTWSYVLEPDAWTSTSAEVNGQLPHSDFEIFSPDYIASGVRRPEIQVVHGGSSIQFGSSFQLTVAVPGSSAPALDVESVSLISCGAVTHHFDWDQRFLWLPFVPSAGSPNNVLTVTAPASGFVAPPGWYMLFVNSVDRVPSIAAFVELR